MHRCQSDPNTDASTYPDAWLDSHGDPFADSYTLGDAYTDRYPNAGRDEHGYGHAGVHHAGPQSDAFAHTVTDTPALLANSVAPAVGYGSSGNTLACGDGRNDSGRPGNHR